MVEPRHDDPPLDPVTHKALHTLLAEGMCAQVMGVLTTGAFLVAFALLLGASYTTIGLIAAIAPLSQILQIPAIYLVNWTRRRRLLVVVTCIVGRLFWFLAASLPWFAPEAARIPLLLISLCMYFGLTAIASCSYNSWVRDLVPESIMGAFFARRMAYATALGAGLSLLAGIGVDLYQRQFENPFGVYSILFVIGGSAGLLGVSYLARIPEPPLDPGPNQRLFAILAEPFKDANFRNLIFFLSSWNFAVNVAAPFFAVYMLQRLELDMSWVLGLAVLSQVVNVVFFRVWGRLADRYTNKSVLTVSGPLFIITFLIWPFTTMPEKYLLTIPLLIVIHVLAGISTAGVGLCAGNIALRNAPYGRATAYLAVNALVSGIAATIAPILAGSAADWFSKQEMTINLQWITTGTDIREYLVQAVSLRGLDFLFIIAFVLGLYATHRLLAVREEGEVEESIVLQELYSEVRKFARSVSNVAGMRHLTYFPYSVLRSLAKRPRGQGIRLWLWVLPLAIAGPWLH